MRTVCSNGYNSGSGVNKENTRYTTEGGYYSCDKIRFRQGTPEKIGGWVRISSNTFDGVCRSLWNWTTLAGLNLLGVGTNTKFYIENGGAYYDVTPIRDTVTLSDPFTATNGSNIITVTDASHGCNTGDYVTFSGAVGLGGNITASVLNQEFQVTVISTNSYTITVSATANATDAAGSPGGGASVSAAYQINSGPSIYTPLTGWGAGSWGSGAWGVTSSSESIRLWSQSNFGEDLVMNPRGGGIYYWDATAGTTTRAVNLTTLSGASDVPTECNFVLISDQSRITIALGCNDIGSSDIDPMLIRWSDQEDVANWTPSAISQAGGIRLSHGSEIVGAIQSRQEILIWTDTAMYSMQYVGAPEVWTIQLLGDNISICSQNAPALASGVVYWMGVDKFYKYDGRVQTLRCDLRQYVYQDFNQLQEVQVFAGTNEAFNEAWWFYCTAGSNTVDRYVVYNYLEDVWYYGSMARTAWLDSGLRSNPLAATYSNNVVSHEVGNDDNTTGTPVAINAYIETAEFDIDDGHNFSFIWRVLPDITFRGSSAGSPSVTMYLKPLRNSGSGYNDPESVGGSNSAAVTRTAILPVEEFTGQIYTRVRGRQLAMKVESTGLGVAWQLGSPRLDLRADGRR